MVEVEPPLNPQDNAAKLQQDLDDKMNEHMSKPNSIDWMKDAANIKRPPAIEHGLFYNKVVFSKN